MGCDYYYCFFLVGRELRLLIVLWSEVKDQNNRVAVFLFTSIGREGRAEEKPPTFVEVGITCLPQTLMLGKLDRCCSSSSADMDKQGIIPPARNGVRVMTVYPANLWGVSLNMLFLCVCVWFVKYGPHAKLHYEFSSNQKISVEFRAINLVVAKWFLWLFFILDLQTNTFKFCVARKSRPRKSVHRWLDLKRSFSD